MTEEEWLVCSDPYSLAFVLKDYRPFRKFRHLACACLHSVAGELRAAQLTQYLELVERLAEGDNAEEAEKANQTLMVLENTRLDAGYLIAALRAALYEAVEPSPDPSGILRGPAFSVASTIDEQMGRSLNRFGTEHDAIYGTLTRCIFGNPFRPVTFNTSWRTSDVVALARGIYYDRAFDRMPILADALQDAGCDNLDILNHCRGAGPHARGCWVIDSVLGEVGETKFA